MAKTFQSPVALNAVVFHHLHYVDGKGTSKTTVRKLISKKVPTTSSGNILFYVYQENDVEYGVMNVTVSEFNKYLKNGEFKLAS